LICLERVLSFLIEVSVVDTVVKNVDLDNVLPGSESFVVGDSLVVLENATGDSFASVCGGNGATEQPCCRKISIIESRTVDFGSTKLASDPEVFLTYETVEIVLRIVSVEDEPLEQFDDALEMDWDLVGVVVFCRARW
jgi:hypothetical protein